MTAGKCWLRPESSSSRDKPVCFISALTWSAPSALAKSLGEICLLGPLPIHELAASVWPLCWNCLRRSPSPPLRTLPAAPPACCSRRRGSVGLGAEYRARDFAEYAHCETSFDEPINSSIRLVNMEASGGLFMGKQSGREMNDMSAPHLRRSWNSARSQAKSRA
jgi:hypothetical protein